MVNTKKRQPLQGWQKETHGDQFEYCCVQYNRDKKRLEITKGEFVGKHKPTRHMSLVKDDVKDYDTFNEDDDNDERGDNDDDVDNDDGQVSFDVVAGDILPCLCFLFWKNGNTLDGWKGH